MFNHGAPYPGIQSITEEWEREEYCEEDDVEDKYYYRDPVEPFAVVWEVVKEDGDDSCAHVYRKPSFEKLVDTQREQVGEWDRMWAFHVDCGYEAWWEFRLIRTMGWSFELSSAILVLALTSLFRNHLGECLVPLVSHSYPGLMAVRYQRRILSLGHFHLLRQSSKKAWMLAQILMPYFEIKWCDWGEDVREGDANEFAEEEFNKRQATGILGDSPYGQEWGGSTVWPR